MPDKLTDSEIVKALECCTKGLECKNCPANPHKGNYGYCTGLLLKDAFDLINRLQAENERLKTNLNIELENYATEYDNKLKSEAYKEVWGKLRGMCDAPNWCVCLSEIDNYFEELVGEDK